MRNKFAETILVRLPNWIGDVVMATPTLRALRVSFPTAHIVGLGKPWVAELLDGHPALDEIITHPFQTKSDGVRKKVSLLRKITEKKPARGLLFPNSYGSALLFYLAKIPKRVGYTTEARRTLLNRGIKPPAAPLHQIDYFLGLMKGFSVDQIWDRSLYLPVSRKNRQEAQEFWKQRNLEPNETVVGLNPGAAWGVSKRWLPEYFARAGELFHQKLNARVVLFGGSEDVPLAEEIAAAMNAPSLAIAGQDNLRILPALISRCNLFITNDTGPMHIATSQNVPQIALFGPTDAQQTAYSFDNVKVLRLDLECAPCFQRTCPLVHHQCMVGITPQQVFEAGMKLISHRR